MGELIPINSYVNKYNETNKKLAMVASYEVDWKAESYKYSFILPVQRELKNAFLCMRLVYSNCSLCMLLVICFITPSNDVCHKFVVFRGYNNRGNCNSCR